MNISVQQRPIYFINMSPTALTSRDKHTNDYMNMDIDIDDDLGLDADFNPSDASRPNAKKRNKKDVSDDDDLGLDTRVVVRKRAKLAKVDDERLLASNALPYIRANASKMIRIKGSGHEYGDLTRILNFYQLWGHRVFPKANFKDFLYMCNKAGQTKARLKVHRQAWIQEEIDKKRQANEIYSTTSHNNEIIDKANDNNNMKQVDSSSAIIANDDDDDSVPLLDVFATRTGRERPERERPEQSVPAEQSNSLFVNDKNKENVNYDEYSDDDDLYQVPNKDRTNGNSISSKITPHTINSSDDEESWGILARPKTIQKSTVSLQVDKNVADININAVNENGNQNSKTDSSLSQESRIESHITGNTPFSQETNDHNMNLTTNKNESASTPTQHDESSGQGTTKDLANTEKDNPPDIDEFDDFDDFGAEMDILNEMGL